MTSKSTKDLIAAIEELLAHPTLVYHALNHMPPAEYHDFMARYEGVKQAVTKAS